MSCNGLRFEAGDIFEAEPEDAKFAVMQTRLANPANMMTTTTFDTTGIFQQRFDLDVFRFEDRTSYLWFS
jgi:hypothetical protein